MPPPLSLSFLAQPVAQRFLTQALLPKGKLTQSKARFYKLQLQSNQTGYMLLVVLVLVHFYFIL